MTDHASWTSPSNVNPELLEAIGARRRKPSRAERIIVRIIVVAGMILLADVFLTNLRFMFQ